MTTAPTLSDKEIKLLDKLTDADPHFKVRPDAAPESLAGFEDLQRRGWLRMSPERIGPLAMPTGETCIFTTEAGILAMRLIRGEPWPRTADGVIVGLHQNVYLDNSKSTIECRSIAPEIICAGFIMLRLDENRDKTPCGKVRTEQGWEFDLDVAATYSSRAALELVLEQRRKAAEQP